MSDEKKAIVVVTGSSRCGTSLMMRMLQAGGVPVFVDKDGGIPNEVAFETDHALTLPEQTAWLDECEGKAVKILEPLRFRPPAGREYRFILMRRKPMEQAKSQIKFLRWMGMNADTKQTRRMANGLLADYPRMLGLLMALGPVHTVSFEELLRHPRVVGKAVAGFLERELDVEKMAAQVITRGPECLEGMLEASIAVRP